MDRIYLDNAASTQTDSEVIKAISEVSASSFGNPSSLHSFGQIARKVIDQSRKQIANFLETKPEEIIFTSGGSESDNLAIRGLIRGEKSHVITSAIEHHAVLHTIQALEKEGKIEATYIKPGSDGIVNPESVKDAIRENTVLVSIMYVNNETGVANPINEIGQVIKEVNKKRSEDKIFFHTDAVQAFEFFNCKPDYLGVDLLTFTGHKFHGPKGIGGLYVRKGTPLKAQITGGSHEFKFRAGTENTPLIAGLAKAIELIRKDREDIAEDSDLILTNEAKRLITLRDKLAKGLLEIPETYLNGETEKKNPAVVNISFFNAEGEAILMNLDFLGIAVSTGSACTSQSLAPSHVLTAMGIMPEKAHGSIRFSLSKYTAEEEIDRVLEVMPRIIKKFREMSPFK